MAWTTPPTFNSGDTLAASNLNILGDDLVYLKGIADGTTWSAVHVARAAAQSISDATDTTVSFDTQYQDAGGWWSSGTDIVVPAGAIPSGFTTIACHVIAGANFATNGTGIRRILVLVNGTEVDRLTLGALSADATTVYFPTYIIVEATDVITMQVHQTSGGTLNLAAGGIWVVRHAPVA